MITLWIIHINLCAWRRSIRWNILPCIITDGAKSPPCCSCTSWKVCDVGAREELRRRECCWKVRPSTVTSVHNYRSLAGGSGKVDSKIFPAEQHRYGLSICHLRAPQWQYTTVISPMLCSGTSCCPGITAEARHTLLLGGGMPIRRTCCSSWWAWAAR